MDVVDAYARMAGEFDKWLFDRIGLECKAEPMLSCANKRSSPASSIGYSAHSDLTPRGVQI